MTAPLAGDPAYVADPATMSTVLPRVLVPTSASSSISMVRAVSQALALLDHIDTDGDDHLYDQVAATADDLRTMLECIVR